MIVDHDAQVMFFGNPKTGSATAHKVIKSYTDFKSSVVIEGPLHMTPKEALEEGLITEGELGSYEVFAFFRDPAERYLSALGHVFKSPALAPQINEFVKSGKPLGPLLDRHQVDWFYVDGLMFVSALDFRHYVEELDTVLSLISPELVLDNRKVLDVEGVPHLNKGPEFGPVWDVLDGEARSAIAMRFQDDYELWGRLYNEWRDDHVRDS